MTKNRQSAVHCVGRQTVTLARPLKTPFQANKAEGRGEVRWGSRVFTRHRHLPSVNKREDLLSPTGIRPDNYTCCCSQQHHPPPPPPHHQLHGERMCPRASCVSFNPETLDILRVVQFDTCSRSTASLCRRVTGPCRAFAVS